MNSPYYRSPSPEEQQLYDHLLHCRKSEDPIQLLERFYCLFIEGTNYPEPAIQIALHKIATSRLAEQEFKFVINRCSRILINYWWFQSHFRWAIAELVYLLKEIPPVRAGYQNIQRLQHLVHQFAQTDEYQSLERLAYVVEEGEVLNPAEPAKPRAPRRSAQPGRAPGKTKEKPDQRSLKELIHRYPYLYPYCLGGQTSDTEFDAIRDLQTERQKKFECDLSRYMTYMVQQSGNPRADSLKPRNPTLLSDDELRITIKHFTGQVNGAGSYQDQARRFLTQTSQTQSYRVFKEGLYRYLVTSVDSVKPEYGKHHFNRWLHNQLKETLPQSDNQVLTSVLVIRTCQQLMDSLIATPQNVGSHLVYVDLINNVGATATIGLLLKILLLYSSLKSNVERRFALLYKHYESMCDGVKWLVESLENLQIAFSLHFGAVKIPCISQL